MMMNVDDSSSENEVFCEKVISELDKVISDPQTNVHSFEIIAVPFKQNKSPIRLVDHHLGIESWCLKYVYQYAHQLIIKNKKLNRYSTTIVKYLNCAILINPDVATFWNVRRHLVERVQLSLTQEFQFSALVLSKKPKSSEAFFYRRWLYLFQSGEAIDWAFEVSLCERCAERKNGNYHAWNHRQWVLQKAPELLSYEINRTEKFIRKNVADYSVYHHRHFVLMKLFDLQYFDIHDTNLNELYQFVNSRLASSSSSSLLLSSTTSDGDVGGGNDDSSNKKINNVNDLVLNLLPNLPTPPSASQRQVYGNKLKSFLYTLNLIIHDLNLMCELTELYGKYEAFNCYRRVIIKLGIDAIRLVYNTDYLTNEYFASKNSSIINNNAQELPLVGVLIQQLDMSDEQNAKFAKIFYF